ncbi:uncharacterized protein LOC34617854 [Cyclospora cayetanensis]|uniref:Uncharacterized protein LOC34617854 n=1 Tax=Cyclospora cayetanensis TaxID=88456 RepID=A0A6P6S337_9EIME|nr:uncharacterized protein LOC34617854 [Cyclospora cayetanensis]
MLLHALSQTNGGSGVPRGGFLVSHCEQATATQTRLSIKGSPLPSRLLPLASHRGWKRVMRQLVCCALLGVLAWVGQAHCQARDTWPSRHNGVGFSLLQLTSLKKSTEPNAEVEEARGAVKGGGDGKPTVAGSVVDPFSAAQVLSTDSFKKQLLAKVHLHRTPDEAADGTKPTDTTPSLLEEQNQVKEATQRSAATGFPKAGAWLQLKRVNAEGESEASNDRHREIEKDEAVGEVTDKADDTNEDTTELKLPANFHFPRIQQHLPVLAEFFENTQDLDDDENEGALKSESRTAAMEAPATSLVESTSTTAGKADGETAKESKSEEDEAEEEEGSEAEPQSSEEPKTGKPESRQEGNSTKASGAEESQNNKSSQEAAEQKDSQESAGSSKEAAEGTAKDEESSKASAEHDSLHGTSVREEAPFPKENRGSHNEGSISSHNDASATEKEDKTPNKSNNSAQGAETKAEEDVHSATESKVSNGKIAAEAKRADEQQSRHDATAKATKAVTAPPEKTEKEKEEEQHVHNKEVAEKATKLANMQRMEQEALLKLHMLGEGGPRKSVQLPSGTSSMSVQDEEQHRQLEKATKTAQSLTMHLRVQRELKQREMAIKQKEIAHLNLLKHIQVLMQSAVSSAWNKLTDIQNTLKQLALESALVNKQFLKETDNRVLRPQELPLAVSGEERKTQGSLAKKTGISALDCPVECAPKTCDNKPTFPTHCFRYDLVAGGGGFRTCAPFLDDRTATCPDGYTRCAMAAPVRGRKYELLNSPANDPLPQALFIKGNNMHSCLKLMAVHRKTECSPADAQSVLSAVKDSQNAENSPPPRVLENGVIFENIQIRSPGEYKLCMLQYWIPPRSPKGEVIVLGVDEIGTVLVQDITHVQKQISQKEAEAAAAANETNAGASVNPHLAGERGKNDEIREQGDKNEAEENLSHRESKESQKVPQPETYDKRSRFSYGQSGGPLVMGCSGTYMAGSRLGDLFLQSGQPARRLASRGRSSLAGFPIGIDTHFAESLCSISPLPYAWVHTIWRRKTLPVFSAYVRGSSRRGGEGRGLVGCIAIWSPLTVLSKCITFATKGEPNGS